jgi:lipooligosaccharide transport system permease protein
MPVPLFECSWGAYRRMETHRIYESVLTAPVTVGELALGEIGWGATRAVMTAAAVLAFAAALGLVGAPWGVGVVVVGVFIGLIFGGMGLIFAALAPSTHAFTLVFTVVATPLYFFSGSFFPIESLPGYLQPVSWALPLTPAVHISRAFTTGEFNATHLYAALYMLALAGAFYPLAVRLLKRRLLV